MLARISGVVLLILGVVILGLGIQLATAEGSVFYLFMAFGLLLSGYLITRRRRSGLAVYAVLLLATLVWSLWEIGLDKWQFIPRGALLAVLGLWLTLPFVARRTRDARKSTEASPLWRGSHGLLAATMALLIVFTIGISFYDPFPQKGELPPAQATNAPPAVPGTPAPPADDWVAYGGNNLGQRYSALKDIDLNSVKKLKLAWEYHTGDTRDPKVDAKEYTFEATPLKVNGMLYLCTPHNRIVALDPATGHERWRFDPVVPADAMLQHQTCRGVSYHDDQAAASSGTPAITTPAAPSAPVANATTPAADCSRRIIAATTDARLFALDANTGKLCEGFGDKGYINLLEGMPNVKKSSYMQTSPPTVTRDLAIVGGSIIDNAYVDNPSGVTRAYNVRTGQIVWKFDAAKPNENKPLAPGETYVANSPTSWTIFAADEALGLVYVPLGNKSPDQLGMNRTPEDEIYTDTIVALDLATGAPRWHFQTSHHDLWDRDNPSQPSLLDLTVGGAQVPAMVLPTKGGNLFVLDRRTGKPVLPVEEVNVSTLTDIPGEKPSPTQPVSSVNFIPPVLKESDMWGTTPIDQLMCRITFKQHRYDGNPWTPPTIAGSLVYPGNIGVFNWGSVAVDPVRQVLIGMPVRLSYLYNFVERPDYQDKPDTRMVTKPDTPKFNENFGARFAVNIQNFRSKLGLPCQAPPWGTMAAVDLSTGKTVWTRRNGTVKDQNTSFLPFPFPIPLPMGIVSHGGMLMTAGGVSFAGATLDNYIRAYNVSTGEEVWKARLPAGGQATPMTYRGANGKQYVVIAAGGHGSIGTTPGDSVLAYTLED
ncbi:membrane-bound PQQ-dependent dehydrogenase, glucose/quinate/shikimate family [Alcaligenaceae bacterium A4P071]|nr:membrane-bound PQQ-dependent dehydrogenase, glucose/quinate/shikimate family [Alcaligenaceae bacterium A4P071]